MPEQGSEIQYPNGFTSILTHNAKDGAWLARLYAPHDQFVASCPCAPENFKGTSDGLLYGYFAGWEQFRSSMTASVEALLRSNTAPPGFKNS